MFSVKQSNLSLININNFSPLWSYCTPIALHRADVTYDGGLYICSAPGVPSTSILHSWLSEFEIGYFDHLLFDRRRQSYFLGRYAAKRALNFLTDEDPAELTIYHGVFDNPVVESNKTPFRFDVSITHSSDVAAAIAFPTAHPMGIDIEQVDQAKAQVVEKELTPYECALFSHTDFGLSHPSMLSMAWTIKESISKVLKTGLMTPFSMYEILSISCNNYVYTSYFKNLSQYKSLSFLINNHVCSITLPKNTNLDISNILTHSSND